MPRNGLGKLHHLKWVEEKKKQNAIPLFQPGYRRNLQSLFLRYRD